MPAEDKYALENQKVLYTLLTPFRWLRDFLKLIVAILGCSITFILWNTLWLLGWGPRGWMAIQARADKMTVYEEGHPAKFNEFTLDFGTVGTSVEYKEGQFLPVKGFRTERRWAYTQVQVNLPDVCSDNLRDLDPGQRLTEWKHRPRTVFDRKSSHMLEAYVTAAIATSVLRTTITQIKMGRPAYMKEPFPLCRPDPYNALGMSVEEYRQWLGVYRSIVIPDSPKVYTRVVRGESLGLGDVVNHSDGAISGMFTHECGDYGDLGFYVTHNPGDLFYEVPMLSPGQECTVQTLIHLMDQKYWLRAAHANGVHADAVILVAHCEAEAIIRNSIAPDRVPVVTADTYFFDLDLLP
jgi:hypothetical protein